MCNGYYIFLLIVLIMINVEIKALKSTVLPKILRGQTVDIKEYPFQVSITMLGRPHCGGTLISDRFIVTAAHCMAYPKEYFAVRIGSNFLNSGGEVQSIKSSVIHPQYNPETQNNDISIIELPKPVRFGPAVRPVTLADEDDVVRVGGLATITGFGALVEGSSQGSPTLQGVRVKVISNAQCRKMYKFTTITNNMICTYDRTGKDGCQGDSGGPLTLDSKLYGISSWGVGCGQANSPGVYTYVPKLRQFIRQMTGI